MRKINKLRKLKLAFHSTLVNKTHDLPPISEPNIFSINNELSLLLMKKDEKLSFYGQISLQVLKGEIEILGYKISKNSDILQFSQEISSFHDENPLEIQSNRSDLVSKDEIQSLLKALIPSEINEFHVEIEGNYAVILIKISKGSSFTQNLSNSLKSLQNPSILRKTIKKLKNLSKNQISSKSLPQPITFSETHKNIINSINKRYISFPKDSEIRSILLFGDKGSGKSKLSHYILNSFISDKRKVSYLDIDLMNPIDLPGIITYYSIDMPILTNKSCEIDVKSKEKYMRFIGETLPNHYIDLFLKSLRNLYEKIKENDNILIINTQGYLKEIGEILLYDIIRIIRPFFLISCGENRVYETLNRRFDTRLSYLKEFSCLDTDNYEVFLVEKLKNQRKMRKDKQIYSYFIDSNSHDNDLNDFIENSLNLPNIDTPSYLNLMRFSKSFSFDIKKLQVLILKEKNSILMNLAELQNINNIEFSLIGLYKEEKGWISQESIENRECLGLGYVKTIDFDMMTIEIIIPEALVVNIGDIGLLVKSQEFGFSNEFYKGFYEESLCLREMLEDIYEEGDRKRDLIKKIPYITEDFDVIGGKPYIQRISQKRHSN